MERQELLTHVKALRAEGKTIRHIASELGVHRSSVHRAVKALARLDVEDNPVPRISVREGERPAPTSSFADAGFVGRQHEMERLSNALADAILGRPNITMLVGEPGIGKTRLSQELASYARSCGARVLQGRCYESMGRPPYWPCVQAILSYTRDCDPERLRSEMGAGASDIAAIVPELRTMLPGLESPADLEPEHARMRLFDSIVTFLKAAARSQPQVLVLDNLHWADVPSLLLLEFMSQELEDARILTIATYRDTDVSLDHPLSRTLGELTKVPHFQRISLTGLTLGDVGTLIERVSGTVPAPALTEQVHQRTEGNPLFVTEVVRLLAQDGVLVGQVEKSSQPTFVIGRPKGISDLETLPLQPDPESRSARIPEGVREAIGTRLYRMSEDCKLALSVASVVGREFGLELLKRLLPEITDDRLLEALDEALAARV